MNVKVWVAKGISGLTLWFLRYFIQWVLTSAQCCTYYYNFVNDNLNEHCTRCKKKKISGEKMWKFLCDIHSVITCVSVWELKTCIQSWECKSASMRVCTCANNTQKLKWKITPLLCPVSITNKARHWRRTNGNSGSCCCLMCLCVVVVSLFRLCHITRVYVRFFHSYMLYTVSLSSQCRLSVVFVFVVCGLI